MRFVQNLFLLFLRSSKSFAVSTISTKRYPFRWWKKGWIQKSRTPVILTESVCMRLKRKKKSEFLFTNLIYTICMSVQWNVIHVIYFPSRSVPLENVKLHITPIYQASTAVLHSDVFYCIRISCNFWTLV